MELRLLSKEEDIELISIIVGDKEFILFVGLLEDCNVTQRVGICDWRFRLEGRLDGLRVGSFKFVSEG